MLALLVAALAAVVFAPSLGGPYIYDDKPLIMNNPFVHDLGVWKRWFITDFWDLGEDFLRTSSRIVYYRPLVTATYALEWRLGGGSPLVFHAANLLWHGLVGWLAFRALLRWSGAVFPAFVAAVLFVVHPTKAESVAWIAGRTDVLCLAALLLVAEGVALRLSAGTEPGSARRRNLGLALEIVGTLLAYGTKEQAVTLPVLVVVEAWAAAGRPAIDRPFVARALRTAAPQLAIGVTYMLLRQKLLPVRAKVFNVGVKDYVQMLLETWGRYFELTFAPHDLSVQQGLVKAQEGSLVHSKAHMALGALGLVVLLGVAFASRRKRPVVALGIAVYVGMLLPTSNVVPTGMITLLSERFLYVPFLGLCLAAAGLLAEAPAARRGLAFGAAGLASTWLAVIAARRSADFLDEDAFWRRERKLHPESMEALGAIKAKALAERRYGEALILAAQLHQTCTKWFSYTGSEIDIIIESIETLGLLTPDGDKAALAAYAGFLTDLVGAEGEAKLERPGLRIIVPRTKAARGRIASLTFRIHGLRASFFSRLGDDPAALAAAAKANESCPRCASVHREAAIVFARAGNFAGAEGELAAAASIGGAAVVAKLSDSVAGARVDASQASLAEEPVMKALLTARAYARLEAWGRAYAELVPHRPLIEKAPGLALTYAELAFRSGDEASARAVLGAVRPPETIGPTLADWKRKMGW